ncbi:MAG: hypothetical protein HY423_04280 [Candidatus Lambdaproteobacteria bacterium]|nr:hypothetical protein [Candidatus Lambdaproteobacteria bacterium]
MILDLTTPAEQDRSRGLALLLASAVLVLLSFVVPPVAPIAIIAYGFYQLYRKNYTEGALAILLAVVVWVLRGVVGWLIWACAFVAAGLGLFFLIRGLRDA